jgi:hypothetical protein
VHNEGCFYIPLLKIQTKNWTKRFNTPAIDVFHLKNLTLQETQPTAQAIIKNKKDCRILTANKNDE